MHTGTNFNKKRIQEQILIQNMHIQSQILSKKTHTGTHFKQNMHTGTNFNKNTHTGTNFNTKIADRHKFNKNMHIQAQILSKKRIYKHKFYYKKG